MDEQSAHRPALAPPRRGIAGTAGSAGSPVRGDDLMKGAPVCPGWRCTWPPRADDGKDSAGTPQRHWDDARTILRQDSVASRPLSSGALSHKICRYRTFARRAAGRAGATWRAKRSCAQAAMALRRQWLASAGRGAEDGIALAAARVGWCIRGAQDGITGMLPARPMASGVVRKGARSAATGPPTTALGPEADNASVGWLTSQLASYLADADGAGGGEQV